MSYIQLQFSFLLFQLSPDPTYAEIKKPQPLSLQHDEVPPSAAVHPYSTNYDQPPSIPLFRIEDEPSISPNRPVIAQYSVIMREHMTPDHVLPRNTVIRRNDSTQSVLKREEIKVIKQLLPFNLLCCYSSRVKKTFIFSRLKVLMFLQLQMKYETTLPAIVLGFIFLILLAK